MSQPFTKHTLPNGTRLITIPRPESSATTALIMVEAGSKYETKRESGLSHFLEHMCFKGTERRPKPSDISEEFDSLGANFNAFTNQEYTGYYATFAPKSLASALDLLSDMYLNSTFPEAEIEKERGVIIEEINMYEDLPMRDVEDQLLSLVYGDQPAGWSIAGSKEVLRGLGRPDFLNYHQGKYVAGATILVIAGRFDESEVLALVEKYFGSLGSVPKASKLAVTEAQQAPGLRVKAKPSDQSHLLLGLRTAPISDPRHETFEVLAAVLGGGMSSRLFKRIRDEMGAAYYVRANHDDFTDHGLLEIAVGADNRRVPEIVEVIIEELNRFRREPVSAVELERVKESLAGHLYLELETSAGAANYHALYEVLTGKLRSPEEYEKQLRAVGAAEIQAAAEEIVRADRLNLALIGPEPDRGRLEKALRL